MNIEQWTADPIGFVYEILKNMQLQIISLETRVNALESKRFAEPEDLQDQILAGQQNAAPAPAPSPAPAQHPTFYTPDPDMVPRHYFIEGVCDFCGHSKAFLNANRVTICHGVAAYHDRRCKINGESLNTPLRERDQRIVRDRLRMELSKEIAKADGTVESKTTYGRLR